MQALILAAGDGGRLKEVTRGTPKSLLEVWGVSILDRGILTLRDAGVRDVVLVVPPGSLGRQIREHYGDHWRGVKLGYVENPEHERGVATSIVKARSLIKDDFLLVLGDNLFEKSIVEDMIQARGDFVVGVDSMAHLPPQYEDGLKVQLEDDRVTGWSKEIDSPYYVTGVNRCSQAALEAYEEVLREGYEDRLDCIPWLYEHGHQVTVLDAHGRFWLDVDTPRDYRLAWDEVFDWAVQSRLKKPALFTRLLNLPLSTRLAKVFARTSLTPNQITGLAVGIASIAFLSFAAGLAPLGGLFAYLAAMVDATDGKVARLKHMSTPQGGFLDSAGDRLTEFLVIVGVGVGGHLSGISWALPLAVVAWAGYIGEFYVKELYLDLKPQSAPGWKRLAPRFQENDLLRLRNRDSSFFLILLGSLVGLQLWALLLLVALVYPALIAHVRGALEALNTYQ